MGVRARRSHDPPLCLLLAMYLAGGGAMSKREAKRQACGVVSRLIESYMDVGQLQ